MCRVLDQVSTVWLPRSLPTVLLPRLLSTAAVLSCGPPATAGGTTKCIHAVLLLFLPGANSRRMLQITLKNPKDLKEVDDVLGKEEMWKNAATTEGAVPLHANMHVRPDVVYCLFPNREHSGQHITLL